MERKVGAITIVGWEINQADYQNWLLKNLDNCHRLNMLKWWKYRHVKTSTGIERDFLCLDYWGYKQYKIEFVPSMELIMKVYAESDLEKASVIAGELNCEGNPGVFAVDKYVEFYEL